MRLHKKIYLCDMKKFLSTTFCLLLAFVITYAGSGINAYSFCCEDCNTYGIEAITGHKCCDVHENDCSFEEQATSEDAFSEETHQECELDRLNLDLQDVSAENGQFKLKAPVLTPLFTATLQNLMVLSENETLTGYVSQTQKPPNLSRLVYFSLLETLII